MSRADCDECDEQMATLHAQLAAKDDQIAKLTDDLDLKKRQHANQSYYIGSLQGRLVDFNEIIEDQEARIGELEQLAIEQTAKLLSAKTPIEWEDRYEVIRHPTTNVHSKDYFRELAANELAIQTNQQTSYLERLEAEFLERYQDMLYYGRKYYNKDTRTGEERRKDAQAALDKLRTSNQ